LTDHEIGERQDTAAELQLERQVTERTAALEAEVARRQAEDAMQEARDKLLRGARLAMISELLASIVHETNQPLGAIVSNGQACLRLLAGPVPDIQEVREALEEIICDAKRASDVLRRARALEKNTLPERKPLDINDMVDEVLALMRPELRTYRISTQAELDRSLPLVQADRFQLQQVVLNLVMNAIEAMRDIDNRPRTLNLKSGLGQDHHVYITVADNGAGLPKVNLDHIFDILFTTKQGGTGMGLSICNSIVRAHGGCLSVTPGIPFGAVFSFSLPAVAKIT
jgi:C4-dicarboxylate-specific signal transduction histidine kinase